MDSKFAAIVPGILSFASPAHVFYYIKLKPLPTFHGCHETLLSHGRVDFVCAMTFALWLLAASTLLELCPRRVLAILFLSPCVAVATHGASLAWFFVSVRASTSRVCCHPSPNAYCTQHSTWAATVFESDGFYLSFVCFCKSRFYFTSWLLVGHEALSFLPPCFCAVCQLRGYVLYYPRSSCRRVGDHYVRPPRQESSTTRRPPFVILLLPTCTCSPTSLEMIWSVLARVPSTALWPTSLRWARWGVWLGSIVRESAGWFGLGWVLSSLAAPSSPLGLGPGVCLLPRPRPWLGWQQPHSMCFYWKIIRSSKVHLLK